MSVLRFKTDRNVHPTADRKNSNRKQGNAPYHNITRMNSTQPIALITGAGSGIGRHLALLLAQQGYAIAAVDICADGVKTLAEQLQARNQRIAWTQADVTDAEALHKATRDLEAQLGPIDLLIANAGIGTETSGLDYRADDMNKVIAVNLIGVSNSIAAVLPGMIERKRGHLVAISSVASYRGLPRMLAYCASKAGVNAIMDGLRVEVAPLGIHVTTICPGWIRTPLTQNIEGDLEHIMEPEAAAQEIAYAIGRKLKFHAFPRAMRWKLGFMLTWPRSWQDGWIRRQMKRLDIKIGRQAAG
jgi:NAD(P)-dependent dehydrogenase (short-subunit alcohol dehydrogenase family)